MPERLPSREELLERLAEAVDDRSVSVPAIKLLLEELRRDADDDTSDAGFDALDELAPRRKAG